MGEKRTLLFSSSQELFLLTRNMVGKKSCGLIQVLIIFISLPIPDWMVYTCLSRTFSHYPVQFGILPWHHLYLHELTHFLPYFVLLIVTRSQQVWIWGGKGRGDKWHQFYCSEDQQQSFSLSLQDRKGAGGWRRKRTLLKVGVETGILFAYRSSNCWSQWRYGSYCRRAQLLPTPLVKLAGTLRKREQVKKNHFGSSGNEIMGRGP